MSRLTDGRTYRLVTIGRPQSRAQIKYYIDNTCEDIAICIEQYESLCEKGMTRQSLLY